MLFLRQLPVLFHAALPQGILRQLPVLFRAALPQGILRQPSFYSFILLFFYFSTSVSAGSFSQKKILRLDFITPSIVRVRMTTDTTKVLTAEPNSTGICVYADKRQKVKWTREQLKDENITRYSTSELIIDVNGNTENISFMDKEENTILCQRPNSVKSEPVFQERVIYDENSAHVEETANGKVTVKDVIRRDTIGRSTRYTVSFVSPDEKGLYGLGAHMEDYMNLQGKTMYLTQHNLKVTVPMLVSTNGYGLLFDAGCAMLYDSKDASNYGCGHAKGYVYTMQLEAAKTIDYYFIKGQNMNEVVAGYRFLTGNVSLMPRYLFGYTQSKERYVSSDDIINTLKEYRRRHVPIDMIVQDWNYWPQGWGYMKMNRKYYPSPKALADSVHAMNAKLMVSIWANPQWCPEADDFKQRGMMLEHDVYDAFNPEARRLYWKYANDEFFSQGFDAWWCDSSEPLDGDWNRIPATDPDGKPYGWDSQAYRWTLNKDVLSEALGAERSNLYSLYHSMGIYENQRRQMSGAKDSLSMGEDGGREHRVVNLTRSSYAGQQRYGTVVWNGDTHASWKSFRQQIPAGLNYMATGNPYWTVDVGSFFTRDDGRRWFYKGEFPNGVKDDNYKEYYTRMFQWATFLPMLRSHGSDTPREIWQFITDEEKSAQRPLADCKYAGAILKMINLRYAHIPYIYSMAAQQSGLTSAGATATDNGSSITRLLAFDYADDDAVLDIKDEFMFGDYLVCPVTQPLSESAVRKVYLPKGDKWLDYWSGKSYEGGQWVDYSLSSSVNTPNSSTDKGAAELQFPLYVRQGAIIPTTEVAEYSDAQFGKPVTINVYPGKDASFTLYEDEGDSYDYEQGHFTLIPLTWNEAKQTLTIGKREGSFPGMLTSRTFIINTPDGQRTVTYKGKALKVKM